MNDYTAAKERTMYFIGVTTGKSSIMKVFPKWADHLGLNAVIKGFDFEPHSEPAKYRKRLSLLKMMSSPWALWSLPTNLDLLKACGDLFEGRGEYAQLLDEASSISKQEKNSGLMPKTPLPADSPWMPLRMTPTGPNQVLTFICWAPAVPPWPCPSTL